MPLWKILGCTIVLRAADHPPLHLHVYRDGVPIGRYDVENRRWMEGPCHAPDQAEKAIREWLRRYG